jgi:hypothetical protein
MLYEIAIALELLEVASCMISRNSNTNSHLFMHTVYIIPEEERERARERD